ncbi:hypothetical protein LTR74_009706 [Friedmanniomyces endolithicus]|nr:hypothetical protein LTR74_009706 [Friedmanniomyces endolithicus]
MLIVIILLLSGDHQMATTTICTKHTFEAKKTDTSLVGFHYLQCNMADNWFAWGCTRCKKTMCTSCVEKEVKEGRGEMVNKGGSDDKGGDGPDGASSAVFDDIAAAWV